jgi:hypothetical protein
MRNLKGVEGGVGGEKKLGDEKFNSVIIRFDNQFSYNF